MKEEIRAYLRLLESPPPLADARLGELTRLLDALAFAVHALPAGEVAPDAIERSDPGVGVEYQRYRALAVVAFPQFGLYPVCDQNEGTEQQVLLADAFDDLADIAHDLSIGLWEWEHNGPEQGAWQLRFDYDTHWGLHLHRLRLYVFVLRSGSHIVV